MQKVLVHIWGAFGLLRSSDYPVLSWEGVLRARAVRNYSSVGFPRNRPILPCACRITPCPSSFKCGHIAWRARDLPVGRAAYYRSWPVRASCKHPGEDGDYGKYRTRQERAEHSGARKIRTMASESLARSHTGRRG